MNLPKTINVLLLDEFCLSKPTTTNKTRQVTVFKWSDLRFRDQISGIRLSTIGCRMQTDNNRLFISPLTFDLEIHRGFESESTSTGFPIWRFQHL